MNKTICFDSPLGKIEIVSTDKGIYKLSLASQAPLIASEDMLLNKAKKQLIAYFNSELKDFDLPLDINRSAFFSEVYKNMLKIPYGQTVSYSQLAKLSGNPKASRAVGMANHTNNIAIIVPCHRVIGKNNKLVGFASGIWRKAALLSLESGKEYVEKLDNNSERIFSFGLKSPKGVYYNQDKDELVQLEKGQARLEVAGEYIELNTGDSYLINANKKHRVDFTSWDCVWYCKYL